MKEEEKQLLLIDLCARLPYGVQCEIGGLRFGPYTFGAAPGDIEDLMEGRVFKPYLRPMSSMTMEEMNDWYMKSNVEYDCEFKPEPTISLDNCHLSTDWLNKHHFDYRGLIEKGLALEAPEDMYKTE